MVTTKKIAIKYTQKEMRKEFHYKKKKNQPNAKEGSNAENEGENNYKAYKKEIAK